MDVGIVIPPNGTPEKPVYKCPFCNVTTTIKPIAWTFTHWIGECDACQEQFYAKVKFSGSSFGPGGGNTKYHFEILETYPKHVLKRHVSIPEHIWEDYEEANKSYKSGANKAAVVMCRRTMQNVALEKGAMKKDTKGNWITLRNQIKSAFPQRDYSLIHEIADEIKYLGDYGAHPQDDGIDKVIAEDAKEILDFTFTILEIGYINPWRILQRRSKRKKP